MFYYNGKKILSGVVQVTGYIDCNQLVAEQKLALQPSSIYEAYSNSGDIVLYNSDGTALVSATNLSIICGKADSFNEFRIMVKHADGVFTDVLSAGCYIICANEYVVGTVS